MKNILIDILAFGTLLSSVLVITSKNPVISVIFLILTFVLTAIFLILKGIIFIGLSYIIIYVGAIAVIFLFVVMMINIRLTDILETENQYTKNLPLAILIGYLFLLIWTSFFEFKLFSGITVNYFQPEESIRFAYINSLDRHSNIHLVTNVLSDGTFNRGNTEDVENSFLNQVFLRENISSVLSDSKIIEVSQLGTLGLNLYSYFGVLLIVLGFVLLLAMYSAILIANKHD